LNAVIWTWPETSEVDRLKGGKSTASALRVGKATGALKLA